MDAPRAKGFFEELVHRLTELSKRSDWSIGFSVGVATYSSEVPSVSDAMARADRLMYVAKKSGATCIECEEVSSEGPDPHNIVNENDARDAVELIEARRSRELAASEEDG
jgi:GGDEF domain-containing protein